MLIDRSHTPDVWNACTEVQADAADVLRALTDPALISLWAPVRFETEELAGPLLRTGSHERVYGSIGGVRTTFEVEVLRADSERLELLADGPVSLEVLYTLRQCGRQVEVEARIALHRNGGLTARVLQAAVAALLGSGALDGALARLADALVGEPARRPRPSRSLEPMLAAA